VRDARFARVRADLLRADTDESITQIAMKWGFRHLGRFAVGYRDRFGEMPSQTRRRATRR
jgi:transcriptional regulator GlxA family with amidase domain